jgi:hypothetical protein
MGDQIELIPFGTLNKHPYLLNNSSISKDLEWMSKKEKLNQDMILIGSPRPLMRYE